MTSHAKNPHAIAAEDWTPWPEEFAHTYREAGYWTGETFPAFLRERATRFAEHTAVVDGHNRWTYAELDRRADSLATGLARLGVAEGDRVVVHLPNTATLLEVIFALFRLGPYRCTHCPPTATANSSTWPAPPRRSPWSPPTPTPGSTVDPWPTGCARKARA